MKMSARNMLPGTIKEIKRGTVNSEMILEADCGGHEIISVITTNSVDRLGLAPGKKANAFVKASNVMMIVDE